MKTLSALVCSVSISLNAYSQDYQFKYFLDTELNSCDPDSATLLGKGKRDHGYVLLDCFSISNGKLVLSAYFNDSSLAVLTGPFRTFYGNGVISREGYYLDGIEHGSWITRDTSGNLVDSTIYDHGQPVKTFNNRSAKNPGFKNYKAGIIKVLLIVRRWSV